MGIGLEKGKNITVFVGKIGGEGVQCSDIELGESIKYYTYSLPDRRWSN